MTLQMGILFCGIYDLINLGSSDACFAGHGLQKEACDMRKRSECAGKLTGQTAPWYLSYGGLSDCVLCFVPLPACHRSCFRCAGRSPHNCTACRLSHVLLDGQCLSQCPDGHFNQEGACTGEYVRGWSTIPMPMFVSIMQPDTVLRHLILGTRVGLYILVLNLQE